jgi:hypothetical protein
MGVEGIADEIEMPFGQFRLLMTTTSLDKMIPRH